MGTEFLQWRGIRDTGHWPSLGSALTEQLWWEVKKSTNEINALKKNQSENPSSFFTYSTLNQNMMKIKKCRKNVADYKVVIDSTVVQRVDACFPHNFSCSGSQEVCINALTNLKYIAKNVAILTQHYALHTTSLVSSADRILFFTLLWCNNTHKKTHVIKLAHSARDTLYAPVSAWI